MLSFDGKKLAPGLNKEEGDQDLFEYEEEDILAFMAKKSDYFHRTAIAVNKNGRKIPRFIFRRIWKLNEPGDLFFIV